MSKNCHIIATKCCFIAIYDKLIGIPHKLWWFDNSYGFKNTHTHKHSTVTLPLFRLFS